MRALSGQWSTAVAAPPDAELVPLRNGINPIDPGTGVEAGMVMLAHRESFNAFFETATFSRDGAMAPKEGSGDDPAQPTATPSPGTAAGSPGKG